MRPAAMSAVPDAIAPAEIGAIGIGARQVRAGGPVADFDRLARVYRWMEWLSLGPYLSRCRGAFLPRLTDCKHALVLGDGDGRFTARLLRENRGVRVHAVDASRAMLDVLVRRCGADAGRVSSEQADLRGWEPGSGAIHGGGREKSVPQGLKPPSLLGFCGTTEVVPFQNVGDEVNGATDVVVGVNGATDVVPFESFVDEVNGATDIDDTRSGELPIYDLVVTHFFLDCLSTGEVFGLAERIRPNLCRGALWVVSEFAVPAEWFGRLVAGPVVRGLYWAFGLLTGLRVRALPDYAAALLAAGFMRVERRSRLGGLLVSELWIVAKRTPNP